VMRAGIDRRGPDGAARVGSCAVTVRA